MELVTICIVGEQAGIANLLDQLKIKLASLFQLKVTSLLLLPCQLVDVHSINDSVRAFLVLNDNSDLVKSFMESHQTYYPSFPILGILGTESSEVDHIYKIDDQESLLLALCECFFKAFECIPPSERECIVLPEFGLPKLAGWIKPYEDVPMEDEAEVSWKPPSFHDQFLQVDAISRTVQSADFASDNLLNWLDGNPANGVPQTVDDLLSGILGTT